jgi:hypothetical protein
MSKKKQITFSSLLFVGAIFLGLIFLEGGRAKTLLNAVKPGLASGPVKASTALTQRSYPALTLTSSRTVTRNNGQTRLLATLQRFQRSDGIFKTVRTFNTPGGGVERRQTHLGYLGLGVFRLDESGHRLIFTGPQVDDAFADVEQFLRAHALFAREESVQGLTTIVWRQPGRAEEDFVEEFRAPALGGLLIRKVTVSDRGREVEEPTAIERGEPSLTEFTELLSLPVDYSRYERRVLAAERTSSPEVANLMRALLERMRQIRPGTNSGN